MDVRRVLAKDWTALLIAGIGAYILYRISRAGMEAIDNVADSIANSIVKWTLPEPVNVTGAAILPDGTAVSMSKLYVQKTPNKEQFWFAYGGKTYQLGARSVQGNYPTRVLT